MKNLRRFDHCIYCNKHVLNKNFAHHIITHHGDKNHVVRIHDFKPGSALRSQRIQIIRNKGNFVHNKCVLKGGGELFVVQRPENSVDVSREPKKFVASNHCYGFLMKEDIYRHACPAASDEPSKTSSTISTHDLKFADRPHISKFMKSLRCDDPSVLIQSDSLMMEYIDKELLQKGSKASPALSNQVRLLSKLLKKMRESEKMPLLTTSEMLTPKMFSRFKECLLQMFNYTV